MQSKMRNLTVNARPRKTKSMLYAVMISLEAGVFVKDSFTEGAVTKRIRNQVLVMIHEALLSCYQLGGPKSHHLDFKRLQVSVERLGEPSFDHVDRVVIKPDGIFAKIEIPPEGPEVLNWDDLRVVVDEN